MRGVPRRVSNPGVAASAVFALAFSILAGCGAGVPDIALPEPPTTLRPSSTTIAPDYSAEQLAGVGGRTTTTVPVIGPGRARIMGTVTGPEGPVAGATVRVQRLVGDAAATLDVISGPDGKWLADNVLGGRYRVRAWRAPDLVTAEPVVFYLEDAKVQPIDFALVRRQGTSVRASIAPSPPFVDEPANLGVVVSTVSVDANGVVQRVPLPNAQVELLLPSDWFTSSPDPVLADGNGRAFWQVQCGQIGSGGLSVTVDTQPFALDIPSCALRPPTTTTDAPTSTVTTATPTTRRASTTSTTTKGRGKP